MSDAPTVRALDIAIIAVYLLAVLGIGLACMRGQNSLRAFFMGNRNVPWWAATCSGIAAVVSGAAYVGAPGQAFNRDYTYHQMRLGIPFALLVICGVMLPIFFRLNIYSIYEYLERRFDRRVRLLASFIFIFSKLGYLIVVLYAPSLVIAEALGLPLKGMLLMMGLGTTLYTMAGGMKAVVWTDTLQVGVLLSGIAATITTIVARTPGGLAQILITARAADRLRFFDWSPNLHDTYTVWNGVIGGAVVVISMFGANQGEIQRFLSTKSIRHANRAMICATLISVTIGIALFFAGTCLFGYYTAFGAKGGLQADPNRIFVKFIAEEMPTGLKGLLIAAALAASMSTMSAMLNSLTTVVTIDFFPLWRKATASVFSARVTTLILGIVITGAAVLAPNLGNLIETSAHIVSLFMGSLTGVFMLGMLSRRVTSSAAFWGLLAGTLAAVGCDYWTRISFMWLSPIAAGVTIGLGHFLTRFSTEPAPFIDPDLTFWRRKQAPAVVSPAIVTGIF